MFGVRDALFTGDAWRSSCSVYFTCRRLSRTHDLPSLIANKAWNFRNPLAIFFSIVGFLSIPLGRSCSCATHISPFVFGISRKSIPKLSESKLSSIIMIRFGVVVIICICLNERDGCVPECPNIHLEAKRKSKNPVPCTLAHHGRLRYSVSSIRINANLYFLSPR